MQEIRKGKPQDAKEIKQLWDNICNGITSYTEAGKLYGVSDNAVRKRFKTAGYTLPKIMHPGKMVDCEYCGNKFYKEHNRLWNSRGNLCKRHFCCTEHKTLYYKENHVNCATQ